MLEGCLKIFSTKHIFGYCVLLFQRNLVNLNHYDAKMICVIRWNFLM